MEESKINLQSIKVSDSTKKILSIRAAFSDLYDDFYTFIDKRYGKEGAAELRDNFEKKFYDLDNLFREEQANLIDENLSMTNYKEI